MKLALSTIAAAFLAFAVAASAAPPSAKVVIRHQMRGCHSWSVNGGTWKASQKIALARGGTVTVIDNDIMPHLLYQVSGPATTSIARVPSKVKDVRTPLKGAGLMAHMGASVKLRFAHAGVYVFSTKAGEDYYEAHTVGEDNVLRLTVTVS